jgi:hypothetical protein
MPTKVYTEELIASLARNTPAFEANDLSALARRPDLMTKLGLFDFVRDILMTLFAPGAARVTLTATDDELIQLEMTRIEGELDKIYNRLGPPPNWEGEAGGR